jgi:ADP-ribosylarginine hydrolase
MEAKKNPLNYRACMILAAVGDAMGYKNGSW